MQTLFGLYVLCTFAVNMGIFVSRMDTAEGKKQNPWVTAAWFLGVVNILGFGSIVYWDIPW